jgi:quercetin dioxygenase-like cupin family protein
MQVTRPGKYILSSAAAVILVAVAVGIAQARTPLAPPFPATCTTTGVLADGTTVNTVNVNVDPTKLRTKDAVEVVQICNAGAQGFTSTWHHHAGPIIVNVTSGTLTFYSPTDCAGTTVGAGQTYLESTGDPVLAHNESGSTATWITTQIIPVGAELLYPETTGFCGIT